MGVKSQTVTLRAVIVVPGSVVRTLLAAASTLQVHRLAGFGASGTTAVSGAFRSFRRGCELCGGQLIRFRGGHGQYGFMGAATSAATSPPPTTTSTTSNRRHSSSVRNDLNTFLQIHSRGYVSVTLYFVRWLNFMVFHFLFPLKEEVGRIVWTSLSTLPVCVVCDKAFEPLRDLFTCRFDLLGSVWQKRTKSGGSVSFFGRQKPLQGLSPACF